MPTVTLLCGLEDYDIDFNIFSKGCQKRLVIKGSHKAWKTNYLYVIDLLAVYRFRPCQALLKIKR